MKSWARAPVVSASSQAIGLVQLLLILTRAGTNEATDAYFYLFTLGLVPINCIVVGMMYPSLLNERKITRRALVQIRHGTPLICVAFVAGGAWWLYSNGRLGGELAGLTAACALNALVQARLWFRAVASEASGNAVWIAGVALPANLFAVAALLPSWHSPAITMTAMTCGLVLGNLVLLGWLAHRDVGAAVISSAPEVRERSTGSSGWFLSLATTEFVGQSVLQSLAVLLPPSSITLLNVGYKIVGSVSATFVNATMPRIVHQDSDSPALARRFLRVVVVTLAVGGVLLLVGTRLVRPDALVPALVVALWLVTSASGAVAARMAFRFLPPHASTRTIIAVIAVVALAVLSSNAAGFGITVLLCAYAAIDGAAAMLLLWPLRDRLMSLMLAGTMAGLGAIWVSAYV